MKIKILSWNIWCGTYLEEVIKFLKTADADIIALQEVAEDEKENIAETIAKALGYQSVHEASISMPVRYLPNYKGNKGSVKFGNAILSKYDIVGNKIYQLAKESKKSAMEANIKVGSNILHVFSIHLKHTHQKPMELQDLQAENLLKFLPEKNTIVMGDFNALPESSVIEKVNEVLEDAEKNGATPTWSVYKEGCIVCQIGEIKYKLDYIFTSRDLRTESFKVLESKGSDHLPISAIVEI